MSKILVLTGCAGFIGFNFLKHAVESNVTSVYDKIYSIDKMGYATQYNENEYLDFCKNNNVQFVASPLSETKRFVRTTVKDKNVIYDVVNFASESHVDRSIESPDKLFSENVLIPSQLVNGLGRDNINKFIHISTDEVYGDLPLDASYTDWFTDNTRYNPNNPYAASKASQDHYLMSLKHTYGFNVQFIRLANQFGPYQHPEKMFPVSILRSLSGENIKVYGDGKNIRQWTPVVQSVKIIYDQLMSEETETLLIAKKYTPLLNNNEVVQIWKTIILDLYNIQTGIEYIEDRLGHDKMYALKTTDYVDSYFDTTLSSEFEKTIKHYYDNRRHYLGVM